jgi:hypothetical protein
MPQVVDITIPGGGPAPVAPEQLAGRGQEVEILAARRAFSTAQTLLAGGAIQAAQNLTVGWHDSSVNGESGSFAVVQANAGLDDLIGEVVMISFYSRSVFAYVLEDVDVPVQLSVTRRLFLALNRLSIVQLPCRVVPVA